MAEKKKKIPVFGLELNVSEVPITGVEECVNRYTLEDGTVLKVKSVAMSIMRIDGQFLPDGSPIYLVAATPVAAVESSVIKKDAEKQAIN